MSEVEGLAPEWNSASPSGWAVARSQNARTVDVFLVSELRHESFCDEDAEARHFSLSNVSALWLQTAGRYLADASFLA